MFSDQHITKRTSIPRPPRSLWQPLVQASTSMVCDGQGRRGALDAGLRPVTSVTQFCGPALTVQCRPGDNLTALAAVEDILPGDVVVLVNGGYRGAALIGGNYVAMVKARGAAAIVCDAPARDVVELRALGLPVFARGVSPAGPMKVAPGNIGFEVAIGAVSVRSGDLVIGDDDGVVVVRREEIAATTAGYQRVRAGEASFESIVKSGALPPFVVEYLSRVKVHSVGDEEPWPGGPDEPAGATPRAAI